tara:strand:- start:12621 stop:14447 length:1827 start_codon:yes stop_codon:yes gene_type:complete
MNHKKLLFEQSSYDNWLDNGGFQGCYDHWYDAFISQYTYGYEFDSEEGMFCQTMCDGQGVNSTFIPYCEECCGCEGSTNNYYGYPEEPNGSGVASYEFCDWSTMESVETGCNNPAALNFNPMAIESDGSCQYGPGTGLDLGENMEGCMDFFAEPLLVQQACYDEDWTGGCIQNDYYWYCECCEMMDGCSDIHLMKCEDIAAISPSMNIEELIEFSPSGLLQDLPNVYTYPCGKIEGETPNENHVGMMVNLMAPEPYMVVGVNIENFDQATPTTEENNFSIAGEFPFGCPSGIQLVDGCTDPQACNYDPDVNNDNGSCEYAEQGYDCDGTVLPVDCGVFDNLDSSSQNGICNTCPDSGSTYCVCCPEVEEDPCEDFELLDSTFQSQICDDQCPGSNEWCGCCDGVTGEEEEDFECYGSWVYIAQGGGCLEADGLMDGNFCPYLESVTDTEGFTDLSYWDNFESCCEGHTNSFNYENTNCVEGNEPDYTTCENSFIYQGGANGEGCINASTGAGWCELFSCEGMDCLPTPQYTSFEECCENNSDDSYTATNNCGEPMAMSTPTMDTPGAPQPKNYKLGGEDPEYLTDKKKFIGNSQKLKEQVERIKKLMG